MGFKIEIGNFVVPTQKWEDNNFKNEYENKVMKVKILLGVVKKNIYWLIEAPHNETSQKWRDEIFWMAAMSHKKNGGCSGYYRGTDSLHVKMMHQSFDEAKFNHNHYEFDEIIEEITPEMLEAHLNGFLEFNNNIDHKIFKYGSGIKYLSIEKIDFIMHSFKEYYFDSSRKKTEKECSSSISKLTPEDKKEMEEYLKIKKTCHQKRDIRDAMAGIGFEKAKERLHYCDDQFNKN